MKKTYTQRVKASALICFLAGAAAMSAHAQSQWFQPTVNGGTYNWEDPAWNAPNSGGAGTDIAPFTSTWVAGQFARFGNSSSQTFTVNVNASESMAGMFLTSGSASILNLNSGGGSLSIVAGTAVTQNGYSWLPQGFLTGGGTVNLNASLTGSGGVEEEAGGGNLNLYGNNSYTGGFLAASSATFIGFNNVNSFGGATSQIGFQGTTFAIMNNTGASGLTIANPMQFIGTGGVNFIGNSVNMNGTFYLGGGANAINLRNNGVAGTVVNFGGVISATSGNVTYSGANGGIIKLSAQNTYTGKTIIGVTGDTSITLQMGVNSAIANSTGLTMSGGTLGMNGTTQTVAGTLGLTTTSTIDFANLAGSLTLGNSSGNTWTGTLNVNNFNPNIDHIFVGTDATGLTSGQLSDFSIDGGTLGPAAINSFGEVYLVPEPSTLALGTLSGLSMLWMAKRRKKA